jgi:hypothetical protein
MLDGLMPRALAHAQGLAAMINVNFAGKRAVTPALATTTSPDSSGCRNPSSTSRPNSGASDHRPVHNVFDLGNYVTHIYATLVSADAVSDFRTPFVGMPPVRPRRDRLLFPQEADAAVIAACALVLSPAAGLVLSGKNSDRPELAACLD